MIDLRGDRSEWPGVLKPIDEDHSLNREPFLEWWRRVESLLPGVHALAAEQWIHRHWSNSPYFGIPLQPLTSRIERWSTDRILADVYIGETLYPAHDYDVLRDLHTGKAMIETGTWDYPLLVMAAPKGFEVWSGRQADSRFCLIEGHQRFRFLNALAARGEGAGDHEVLILQYMS